MATQVRRIANLDLLRAVAISLVIPVNLVGEGVVDAGPTVNHVLESGWVGVDLFFVLSGWLIGGLYWREYRRHGDVEIGRFWTRRWFRTIPPYLVALFIVWGALYAVTPDPEPFDLRYLVFVQNYTGMPYWSVSWSLCVEEHFYLALPVVLGLALRIRGGVPTVLAALAAYSLIARMLTVPDDASPWGLHYTATHMRFEGLALGVAAAWVRECHPERWPTLRRAARAFAIPGLVFVASVPWLPINILNRFAYTGVALAFVALVVATVDARPLPFARSRAIRAIALTSYSVYMTHTVVADAYREVLLSSMPSLPTALHVLAVVAAIGAVGGAFYATVERPTLWLRRRFAPRRSSVPSPALGDSGHPVATS